MLSTELQALRGADLNWAMMLRSVWEDGDADVPELQGDLREEFVRTLEDLIASRLAASPAGWVIAGEGGSGKTHLLSRFRAECVRRNACFVLIDMTDVRDFWETVANGYYHSLQQALPDGTPQYIRLLSAMLQQLTLKTPVEEWIKKVRALGPGQVLPFSRDLLKALGAKHRAESVEHANVIRAVVGLCGGDIEVASIAGTWLMGEELDGAARGTLGISKTQERGSVIVRGLSWLMSLAGFSVVALDQLDPIVTQLHLEKEALQSTPATAIINKLGMGLCELRDVTRRTLIVVSCVDRTWRMLSDFTPKQYAARYLPMKALKPLESEKIVESILVSRLGPAERAANFKPPYPTWPFRPEWLVARRLSSPREVLIACHNHVSECLRRGEVKESPPGWGSKKSNGSKDEAFARLDEQYLDLRAAVDVADVLSEPREDDRFGGIVQAAVYGVAAEVTPPPLVDVIAEESFTGAKGNPPLHARLRLVFHGESSREEHVCLRALQRKNAAAFKTRLRSAITQAGIDKALKFRRLYMLRSGPPPGGAETKKLLDQFDAFGGHWLAPNDNDVRTLAALRVMRQEADPHLAAWMQDRRHASQTSFARTALSPLFRILGVSQAGFDDGGAVAPGRTTDPSSPPPVETAADRAVRPAESASTGMTGDAPAAGVAPPSTTGTTGSDADSNANATAPGGSSRRDSGHHPRAGAAERAIGIGDCRRPPSGPPTCCWAGDWSPAAWPASRRRFRSPPCRSTGSCSPGQGRARRCCSSG